jgi:hypothetical protein
MHADKPHVHGRSQEEVAYHLDLLYEAGLIWSEFKELGSRPGDAELAKMISQYMTRRRHDSYRLTWAGHEFLDAARDNTRWRNAKRKVVDTTGGLAFEFLRAVLMQKGKELLGLE